MKPIVILISGLLAGIATTADGQTLTTATQANQTMASATSAQGKPYKHRVSFPAGALS